MRVGFKEDVVRAEVGVPGDSIVVGGDVVAEGEGDEIRSVTPRFIDIFQLNQYCN